MKIIIITWVICFILCCILFAKSLKKQAIQSIEFDNEDDAFATILSQIFKSRNEIELKKMIKYIIAYDEQFNNEKDLDYFIDIWDKRYNSLKPNKS